MIHEPPALPSVLPEPDQAEVIPTTSQELKAWGIYGFDSIDHRSRSFNLIRSRLIELSRERSWRMFGIVSATPQVGKSFIAANLAASLSRTPKVQTYLMDLDLRRGSVSILCGLAANGNVGEYLEHADGADRPTAYRFESENLVIVPTKPKLAASAELLAGQRAQNLFQAMRSSGPDRLFIVDLPPVFANDDASIAMVHLDAYILVAEEGKTTERELKDVTALLGEDRQAGVILNKYRGGVVNEGYGVNDYYSSGYDRISE
ncbi:MAG TPA: CpsD/CapB family tyrosine-protein kinase [Sphingomicrobium sp.]|nr:CpsD/CapB family tyrosine-protein kinase [Sphingomicrobium sp.]